MRLMPLVPSLRRLTTLAALAALAALPAPAQHRGRKYKAPPETSHVEVLVTKKSNGKPIQNAAVIFHPIKDGKDEGNLEVKTDPEGKATVDMIPTGSTVRVQVIANGFATYAEDIEIADQSKSIAVALLRPQEQVSAYEDNTGKAASRAPGVQEPIKHTAPPPAGTPPTPTQPPSGPVPPPPSDTPTPPPTASPQS